MNSFPTYTLWMLLFFLIPLAVTLQSETASPNCLTETNRIYYIISSPVPKNSRSISKSSPLNLADTRVGKSLNKNKFVYVLGEGAPKEDNMRCEPTLPSTAAKPGWLSQRQHRCPSRSPSISCPRQSRPPSSCWAAGTGLWFVRWGRCGLSTKQGCQESLDSETVPHKVTLNLWASGTFIWDFFFPKSI